MTGLLKKRWKEWLKIDELKERIKNILEVPYISEEDTVMDGSFTMEPVISGGLRGNGTIQSSIDYYMVNLFYSDKKELVVNTKRLCSELLHMGMICDTPDYTYEKEGRIWRGRLRVGIVGG